MSTEELPALETLGTVAAVAGDLELVRLNAAASSDHVFVECDFNISGANFKDVLGLPYVATATVQCRKKLLLETFIAVHLAARLGGINGWMISRIHRHGFALTRHLPRGYELNAVTRSRDKVIGRLLGRAAQRRVRQHWARGTRRCEVLAQYQRMYYELADHEPHEIFR